MVVSAMTTDSPRTRKKTRAPTGGPQKREARSLRQRKYRKPVERVKRPAETTTLGAAVLAAVVSGLGFDGAGVDTTTWLTAAVGIVPFVVSPAVDFFRERKEERELRAELSERVVYAVEKLAGLELPADKTREEEEGSTESGDDKASILDDFLVLLERARMPQTPDKAKKDGDGVSGEGGRAGSATDRDKQAPARKPPPRAHA